MSCWSLLESLLNLCPSRCVSLNFPAGWTNVNYLKTAGCGTHRLWRKGIKLLSTLLSSFIKKTKTCALKISFAASARPSEEERVGWNPRKMSVQQLWLYWFLKAGQIHLSGCKQAFLFKSSQWCLMLSAHHSRRHLVHLEALQRVITCRLHQKWSCCKVNTVFNPWRKKKMQKTRVLVKMKG